MDPARYVGSSEDTSLQVQGQTREQHSAYNMKTGGHFGVCQDIVSAGGAPPAELYTGKFQNVGQGLTPPYRDIFNSFWQKEIFRLERDNHDYKTHALPLARIKKVMKADPDVKMISAEAPIVFAEACDIFIIELTMRAWIHAEENKRRTLQRSDIAAALGKSDMYDFLIDIVPRVDSAGKAKKAEQTTVANPTETVDALQSPTLIEPSSMQTTHDFMTNDNAFAAQSTMFPLSTQTSFDNQIFDQSAMYGNPYGLQQAMYGPQTHRMPDHLMNDPHSQQQFTMPLKDDSVSFS